MPAALAITLNFALGSTLPANEAIARHAAKGSDVVLAVPGLPEDCGEASVQQPIVVIAVKPEASVFNGAAWNKPIVIKSAQDAARYFGKDSLDHLGKQVDFAKQHLLIFAWKGSGGDKLSFAVAESFPEQIFFSRKAGFTRDLRSHTVIYAVRSNVRWSVREGR